MKYYIEVQDTRNELLLDMMIKRGYDAHLLPSKALGDEEEEKIAYVFSPIRRLGLSEIDGMKEGSVLYCGETSNETDAVINAKNILHINYLRDAEFLAGNAKLTAEGALCLLMEKTPKSIFEYSILVLGNGKCGSAIAELFSRVGLSCSVACRSLPIFKKSVDYYSLSSLENIIQGFDCIINTIPAPIIHDGIRSRIKNTAVFIEIASSPCLDTLGMHFSYIHARGLPQLYCTESAAELMFFAITK